jgi:hypothetical protein
MGARVTRAPPAAAAAEFWCDEFIDLLPLRGAADGHYVACRLSLI